MRKLVLKFGIIKTVIAITVFSIIFSVLLTFLITYYLGGTNIQNLVISGIIPLLIAPTASFPFIKLILDLHNLEIEIRHLASYDKLTKLLNRGAFFERAMYALEVAKRERQDFSILSIDLDYFKKINDNFGHAAGDAVLTSFGSIVIENFRKSDILGRIGGEEFVIFLPNTSDLLANLMANRLLEKVRESIVDFQDRKIKFTSSIGICSFKSDTPKNLNEILQQVDIALYEAKAGGRNKIYKVNENYALNALVSI